MTVEPKNIRKPAPIKEVQNKIDDILSKTPVTKNTQPPNTPPPTSNAPRQPPDININIKMLSQIFNGVEKNLLSKNILFYDPEEKGYIIQDGTKIDTDYLEALNKKCIQFIYTYSKMKDLPEGSLKQFLEAQEELKNMKVVDTDGNEVPHVSTETSQSDQNPPVYI